MRKNPSVVQCKLELESTVASLRHILISPGVRRGLSQSGEERQGENSAQRQCGRVPAPLSLTTAETATAVGMSHAHRGRAKRAGTVIQQDAAFKHLRGTGRAKEAQKKKRKSMHQLRKRDGADLQDDSDDGIDTDTQPDAVIDDSDSSAVEKSSTTGQLPRKRIKKKKQNKKKKPDTSQPELLSQDTANLAIKMLTQAGRTAGKGPVRPRGKLRISMKPNSTRQGTSRKKAKVTYDDVIRNATQYVRNPQTKNDMQAKMQEILVWRTRRFSHLSATSVTLEDCMQTTLPEADVLKYVDSPAYDSAGFGDNCKLSRTTRSFLKTLTHQIYRAEVMLGLTRILVPGKETFFVLAVMRCGLKDVDSYRRRFRTDTSQKPQQRDWGIVSRPKELCAALWERQKRWVSCLCHSHTCVLCEVVTKLVGFHRSIACPDTFTEP